MPEGLVAGCFLHAARSGVWGSLPLHSLAVIDKAEVIPAEVPRRDFRALMVRAQS